jgi:hypothetical protein
MPVSAVRSCVAWLNSHKDALMSTTPKKTGDKYEQAAENIIGILQTCEYDYDAMDEIRAYLHEAFPPVPVAESVRKLALKIRSQKDNEGIMIWPEFEHELTGAAALIQSYIDGQAEKESSCHGCINDDNSAGRYECVECKRSFYSKDLFEPRPAQPKGTDI